MPEVSQQLLDMLDGLDEASQFCISDSLSPILPGLVVEDIGSVGLPIAPHQAQQLIQQAVQATWPMSPQNKKSTRGDGQ